MRLGQGGPFYESKPNAHRIAVAVVVGLLLSTYVYRAFKNASAVKPFIAQHIVVAAIPLQLGTRVDANNLRLIPWPSDEPCPECSRGLKIARTAR